MQPRVGFAAQVVVGNQQDLEIPSQVFFGECFGGARQAQPLVGRGGNQIRVSAADARDQQIAEMPDGFAAEMLEVAPLGKKGVHQGEHPLG